MTGPGLSPGTVPISVVVPTRNVETTIAACLQSILDDLRHTPHEVLVVDNGSTDGTLDIVRRLPVRLEVIPGGFVSRSRNVGARAAAHPLLAFIDSDCVVRSGWGQAVRAVLADESIGVTGSRHVLRDHATWVERAWDRAHRRRSPAALVPTAYIPAGNLATRRDVFLAVDGFDESLETGEDPDLCARIAARGHRVVEARDVQCVHLGEPRTLGDVFRRERWHGRGARLRYGDGRLAPIMISSTLFAVCLAGAVAGVLLAPMIGSAWPLVLLTAPLAVPMIYAARYARGDVGHGLQLLAIYAAYFAARTAALPVVASRAWRRARMPAAS